MTETASDLREHYPEPKGRAVREPPDRLDGHCHRFIGLSPFVVMATVGAEGRLDASPRGGAPGFARVRNDRTLWLPDASGNNRLNSLSNVADFDAVADALAGAYGPPSADEEGWTVEPEAGDTFAVALPAGRATRTARWSRPGGTMVMQLRGQGGLITHVLEYVRAAPSEGDTEAR